MYRSPVIVLAVLVVACGFVAGFAVGMATEYYVLTSTTQGHAASLPATITPNISYVEPSVSPTPSVDEMRKTIMRLVNDERVTGGLKPLTENSFLNQSAELKAKDMAAKGYWSHNSPSGDSPWDFFDQAGYRYLHAGENLARDYTTPQAVVTGWMNSETHRKNILTPVYTETGLAVIYNKASLHQVLVVQHFGNPVVGVSPR